MTTTHRADLTAVVLERFAAEPHTAGPEQLEHLARHAEARYCTDLGERMRKLVDQERAARIFAVALMPMPPADDLPQAGPSAPLVQIPVLYTQVAGRLGLDFWAQREERWEQAGMVGHPSDAEYDDFFYFGGEGGSR